MEILVPQRVSVMLHWLDIRTSGLTHHHLAHSYRWAGLGPRFVARMLPLPEYTQSSLAFGDYISVSYASISDTPGNIGLPVS